MTNRFVAKFVLVPYRYLLPKLCMYQPFMLNNIKLLLNLAQFSLCDKNISIFISAKIRRRRHFFPSQCCGSGSARIHTIFQDLDSLGVTATIRKIRYFNQENLINYKNNLKLVIINR